MCVSTIKFITYSLHVEFNQVNGGYPHPIELDLHSKSSVAGSGSILQDHGRFEESQRQVHYNLVHPTVCHSSRQQEAPMEEHFRCWPTYSSQSLQKLEMFLYQFMDRWILVDMGQSFHIIQLLKLVTHLLLWQVEEEESAQESAAEPLVAADNTKRVAASTAISILCSICIDSYVIFSMISLNQTKGLCVAGFIYDVHFMHATCDTPTKDKCMYNYTFIHLTLPNEHDCLWLHGQMMSCSWHHPSFVYV